MKRIILFILFLLLITFNFTTVFLNLSYEKNILFTGRASTGAITFTIIGEEDITIISPLNTTYSFGLSLGPYPLELNVTNNTFLPESWWYSLWDMKHTELSVNNQTFSPDTMINATRWDNKLYVYANNSSGSVFSNYVSFYIDVGNHAPVIEGDTLNQTIYVCEDDYLRYFFNATDIDEEVLTPSLSDYAPFYIERKNPAVNWTAWMFEIYSGIIYNNLLSEANKDSFGNWWIYPETVGVTDSGALSDTKEINITIIERNDAPIIQTIGVQTIWVQGIGTHFYKQVQITEEEGGIVNYNLSFSGPELFEISSSGLMDFTADESYLNNGNPVTYDLTVCVNDTGLDYPHEYIDTYCFQDGSSQYDCETFGLTITNDNRNVSIIGYSPTELFFNLVGTEQLFFEVIGYDPDGTIPDAYWYLDDVLLEYDSGSSINNLSYSFACGIASGNHTFKAEITDGLSNDSVEWIVNHTSTSCPLPPTPGGGGGGGGIVCTEKWACEEWKKCKFLKDSYLDSIGEQDYLLLQQSCSDLGYPVCGYQKRDCIDLNNCSNQIPRIPKPDDLISCYYTDNPDCSDGIKNCHHGSCELGIDCGGFCDPCPTCSDGIQNQGEKGIDCEGPCSKICPPEFPLKTSSIIIYLLILLIILILVLILFRIFLLVKRRKKSKREGHR